MKAETMRKLAVALLSIALLGVPGLRGLAAAQTPVTRIVYEQCRADGTWNVSCFIGLAVDGSDTLIANGFGPKWSPDGSRIAFTGSTDPSAPYSWDSIPEVLVLNLADGSITNLTDPATGWGPVWSPDGGKIAFLSGRDGAVELYVMEASGANPTRVTQDVGFTGTFGWSPDGGRLAFASDADGAVTRVAAGTGGVQPAWSPDGQRLIFTSTIPFIYTGICYFGSGAHNADDFCVPVSGTYLVNADGTGLTALASASAPDWFRPLAGQPVAAFTSDCNAPTCDFDAAGSFDPDGTIASYVWQFGDGTSDSGPTAHHVYATGDPHNVTLSVTDDSGATGIVRKPVPANIAPVASFTVACSGPTCTFDGSGSSDPDGTIASYTWYLGDGQVRSGYGAHLNYTYHTGTFSPTLIVADNSGATGTAVQTLSVVNALPVATFTSTCNGLTCTFDGSGSSDPDGTITRY